jgi:hypothetical protein
VYIYIYIYIYTYLSLYIIYKTINKIYICIGAHDKRSLETTSLNNSLLKTDMCSYLEENMAVHINWLMLFKEIPLFTLRITCSK